MNDLLKKKIESNSELNGKIGLITTNYFPFLPEGMKVVLVDKQKNDAVIEKMRQEAMKLNGLTEDEKKEIADMLSKSYFDVIDSHNKNLEN